MAEPQDTRPAASPEQEATARRVHAGWDRMSPEEYAARHGADWMCWSFGDYRYADPRLEAWIQGLHAIFFTPGAVERCQKQYLSARELEEVRRRMSEDF